MRPSRTWGSRSTPERTASPALRIGMVLVEVPVHDRCPHLEHQVSSSRRPTHLLAGIHSAVHEPLHRAFRYSGRDRLFTMPRRRVANDQGPLTPTYAPHLTLPPDPPPHPPSYTGVP